MQISWKISGTMQTRLRSTTSGHSKQTQRIVMPYGDMLLFSRKFEAMWTRREELYQRVVEVEPQDVDYLRRFAEFLKRTNRNIQKAHILEQRAQAIESGKA